MPQLFLIVHADDAPCARHIHDELGPRGYTLWTLPDHLDASSPSYPTALERGIRGSSAVVLIWSAPAARDAWVERMLLYSLQLRKPLVTLARDETSLPIIVINTPVVRGVDCREAAGRLPALLPPSDADDFLLALLTHERIREQKQGVTEAAAMIARGERREELLALLEEMARNSLFGAVAKEARKVLDALGGQPVPPTPTIDSRHTFGVRCSKGHVSSFDKREVCPATNLVPRSVVPTAGKELDEMLLHCRTSGCPEQIVVRIDCGGYK